MDLATVDAKGQDDVSSDDATSSDGGTLDVGLEDMGADAPRDMLSDDAMAPDAAVPDTTSPDVLSPDTMSPDVLSPDTMSPDVLSPDTMSPDTMSPDTMSPDTSGPDLPLPLDQGILPADIAVATPACSQGTPIHSFQSNMVICQHPQALTQCQAESACNVTGGWSLCTSSEFLTRGGTNPHNVSDAWLAGCIRSGSTPYTPSDAICGTCSSTLHSPRTLAWACSDAEPYFRWEAFIGLRTRNACRSVGIHDSSTAAYWTYAITSEAFNRVVCCR